MRETISDLSNLKDTMEVIPNDPYQEIYDEVSTDLALSKFNELDLFRHCIETCHKIFELSEFQYGKAAKNIPFDFLDDILTLYLEQFCQCTTKEDLSKEKYAYYTSCLDFPDDTFSLADLSAIIMGTNNNKVVDIDSKRIELWKLNKNYLQKFFGIEFNGKSDSQAEKYETLRLLKILYDCLNECNVNLAYLLRMSDLKQNWKIPNSYSNALAFIKERILTRTRTIDSDYHVDFRTIMELEHHYNAVKSFINSFSEGIINHILEQIDSPCCLVKRFICENIYQQVIDNLKNMSHVNLKKIDTPEAIQYYAYEHFLMTDIANEEYNDFFSEKFVVEAKEDFYIHAEDFLVANNIEYVSLERITNFTEKYKKELTKIIYSNMSDNNELRKFSIRIERHMDDYAIIGRVYNLGIKRNEFSELNGLEILAIIYLYEYLSDKGTDIPLHSGYNGIYEKDKKRRDLKIKALMKQFSAKLENKKIANPLSEEEFFLACEWLTEQMYILINHRTVEIQILREKMKSALLKYWRETIPLLTESGYTVPLEILIEKILPISQRQEIISTALKIQESNKVTD